MSRLPDFIAPIDITETALLAVLPDIDIPDLGIHITYSPNRSLNARMRALVEVLEQSCGS